MHTKQTHMRSFLAALALAATTVLPASATPERLIVNPTEPMVLVPNLEFLGYSRISTVEHCAALTQTDDWTNMITDEDLVLMENCLIEHT